MLKSLQGKLIIIYLLLILMAMELTSLYLLRSLESYYLNNFRTNLSMHAQLLSGMVLRYLEPERPGQLPDESGVAKLAADFDPESGVIVAVLDAGGRVLGASRRQLDLLGKVLQSDDISHALGGSTGESIGIDPQTGARTLFLAVPVRSGGRVLGIVYLKGSLERTYEILGNIRRIVLYATLLALALTALIGTGLARTITGPIRELTRRAAAMARGDFQQTIQVRSNDEIGQLAAAFNRLADQLNETLGAISAERNKLEAILSYMADGLLALDGEGRVIKVNQAAARMLDAEPAVAIGRAVDDVWARLGLGELVRAALTTGQPVTQEVTTGGAEPRTLLVHTTPLRGDRSPPAGAVVVLHDMTQWHRLETMRRDFVANVSHELKTPLTTVKSYVETLLDGAVADPDLSARFLKVVESETDRMVRLVRDLLQLSELERGTVHWDQVPCDLGLVADEAIARLAVQADRKQIRIRRYWGTDLPPAVTDRDKAQQVFLNILANAIEFTPQSGEIRVTIQAMGPELRVEVRDSGIGIPAGDLPRIFERFYRVDKARSRTLGGTGLGLAIARQIIEGLNGRIDIASQEGEGTTVTFTLPAQVPAADGVSPPPGTTPVPIQGAGG